MPVAGRRRFDLDIAIDLALAGKPQSFLVAYSPKEKQRACEDSKSFPQARLADILFTFGDQHFAATTVAKAHAVKDFVRPPVQWHSIFKSDLSQVAARFDVDAFFLVDECNLGHDAFVGCSLVDGIGLG